MIAVPAADPVRIDGAAMVVWDALVAPRSRPEIVEEVARRLACEPEEIALGVGSTLERLADAHLVVSR